MIKTENMEETLVIGVVAKPQGVRGELKITPYTDDVNRFTKLKSVMIDGKKYSVSGAKALGEFAVISLSGVADRNAAETFRGKLLRVERKDGAPLKENEFYIADVIGCSLFNGDGEKIGVITDITQARTDVFTVKTTDGRIMRFPFLKDLLVGADVANSVVTVKKERLKEVSCYED